jgi:hypothetical protein
LWTIQRHSASAGHRFVEVATRDQFVDASNKFIYTDQWALRHRIMKSVSLSRTSQKLKREQNSILVDFSKQVEENLT